MNNTNLNNAGKGDKPLPVNKTKYDIQFSKINWKHKSNTNTNTKPIDINIHELSK